MTMGGTALPHAVGVANLVGAERTYAPADPGATREDRHDRRRLSGASLLAYEVLRDGVAVAAFFRDHDPGNQVNQDADASEHRDHGERQTHQGRVDTEVG